MTTRRFSLLVILGLLSGVLIFGVFGSIRLARAPSFESAWAARRKWDDSLAKQVIAARLKDPTFRDPRLVLEAGILARQGRAVDATKKLKRLSPVWQERPEVKQVWGELLYAAGSLREAEAQFLSLLREDPSENDVHLWLGVIYYDQMQFDRFFRQMQRCLQLSPNGYRPHRLMGLLHHRFNRFAESAHHFQEALRLGGIADQIDIVSHLAQALLFNRDYAAVVELISKIPDPSGDLWAMLGEAHLSLGSGDEVVSNCVEQALKIEPHPRRVLQFASQIYIDRGRSEEAVAYLNEMLTTAPHSQGALYLLSRAYLKLGRQEDYELTIKRHSVAEGIKKEHDDLIQRIFKNPNDVEALKRAELMAVEMGEPELAKLYSVARNSGSSPSGPNR